MRHEFKHYINRLDDSVLAARLRRLFPHDSHAGSHGFYRVSSLYFDTPYDKAMTDKVGGVNVREKVRLRFYGSDTSFMRLECKQKIGQLTHKKSMRLDAADAQRLSEGDFAWLLDADDPLGAFFYTRFALGRLKPVVQVTYDREAFVFRPGNVRVTLDRHLRSNPGGYGFFDPDVPHQDRSDTLAILEVKFDAFLPEVVRMAVQMPDRRAAAISKYVISRKYDY